MRLQWKNKFWVAPRRESCRPFLPGRQMAADRRWFSSSVISLRDSSCSRCFMGVYVPDLWMIRREKISIYDRLSLILIRQKNNRLWLQRRRRQKRLQRRKHPLRKRNNKLALLQIEEPPECQGALFISDGIWFYSESLLLILTKVDCRFWIWQLSFFNWRLSSSQQTEICVASFLS